MIHPLSLVLSRVRVWLDREVTGKVKHVLGMGAFLAFAFAAVVYQVQTLADSSRESDARAASESRDAIRLAAYESCVLAIQGRNDLRVVLVSIIDLTDLFPDSLVAAQVSQSRIELIDTVYPAVSIDDGCGGLVSAP